MEDIRIFEVETAKLFLLVLARVGGLVAAAPVLGSANFPIRGKIGLAGLTAALLTPTIGALPYAIPDDMVSFAMLGASETLIGVMMGFVMTLVFASIQVGGQIMDMQTGFGVLNVFNPALGTQFPIFGFFYFILAMLFLLATNGHHLILRALVSSFDRIPPGGLVVRPALLLQASRLGSVMFWDGLVVAAPVTAAMFVAYVVMGLIGRVIPQIQLFVVGFPLTMATGLLIVGLSTGVFLEILDGMFGRMFHDVDAMINAMR